MPSELMQAHSLSFDIRDMPTRSQTVTSDASQRPPIFTNESDSSSQLDGQINYSPIDVFQFGGGLTSDGGLIGNIGFQFLGKPWETAESGWSGALRGQIYYSSMSKSGDQNGLFGVTGYAWKGTASMAAAEAGVSFGYRWNKELMGFASASANNFSLKTVITQDASTDGASAGGTYESDSHGHSSAAGVGLLIGTGVFRLIPILEFVNYQIDSQSFSESRGVLTLAFGGNASKKKAE